MLDVIAEKSCTKCNVVKPLNKFFRRKEREGRPSSWCRACCALANSARQKLQTPEIRFKYHLSGLYGISVENYNTIMDAQYGVCALCFNPFDNDNKLNTAQIDHDHETGVIRGILHGRCNIAIGLMLENPAIAFAAFEYLRKHGK